MCIHSPFLRLMVSRSFCTYDKHKIPFFPTHINKKVVSWLKEPCCHILRTDWDFAYVPCFKKELGLFSCPTSQGKLTSFTISHINQVIKITSRELESKKHLFYSTWLRSRHVLGSNQAEMTGNKQMRTKSGKERTDFCNDSDGLIAETTIHCPPLFYLLWPLLKIKCCF